MRLLNLFVVPYVFVEFLKTFLYAVLEEIDFSLVCSQGLEIHMDLLIKDVPAFEVQFL